jgi:2'-5' RNA ligase
MAQPHDLYFFIYLPPQISSLAFGLLTSLGLPPCARRGAQMRKEGLHITVEKLGRFLGCVPHHQLEMAMAAGCSVVAEPFHIQLDVVQSTSGQGGQSMAQLTGRAAGLRGIRDFELSLAQAMRRVGFHERQIRRHFSPHVTLDYRHAPFSRRTVPPLTWQVAEFMLVDSLYGQGKHEVLGCGPLVERQQRLDL